MSVNLATQWLTIILSNVLLLSYQWTPLHVAATKGHDYTVECFVQQGANISIKDNAGVSMTILLNYGS